jgi:acetylornithine deacetylase/succinyl-diaminopimelate desuccinylase-like protein
MPNDLREQADKVIARCRKGLPLRVRKSPCFLEFHIEQGILLESEDLSLGVVQAIAGQNRAEITFTGRASHAGTTPMRLRKDAVAGAAEWVGEVERLALDTPGHGGHRGRSSHPPGSRGNVSCRTAARQSRCTKCGRYRSPPGGRPPYSPRAECRSPTGAVSRWSPVVC